MGRLFHLFFSGLQLANAIIFTGVVMGWLNICPNSSHEFVYSALAIGTVFVLFYMMPSSAVIAGGIIFYYIVWICDLTPFLALFLAAPAIAISLIAMWLPFYDGVEVDHLAWWLKNMIGKH